MYVHNNYVYPNLFCYMYALCNLTEFRSNGKWEYSVPVHPGLPFDKSLPDVGKHHLQNATGKFNFL